MTFVRRTSLAAAVLLFMTLGVAMASWYDDYDAGVNAIRKGQWQVAIQKMTAAIAGNPKENDKARTYGAIFINYHPYYYRGVANLNLGKYEQAVSDLEKASGAGEENVGSIETLMQRAKSKLEAASAPEPQPVAPVPQPVRPQPQPPPVPVPAPVPVPVAPSIDPAQRQKAIAAIANARQHIQQAQGRHANGTPQFNTAVQGLTDANTRAASAKTNDDLAQVVAIADNAAFIADTAVAPGLPPVVTTPQTRPTVAANIVLADYQRQLRGALTDYFNGEFESSTRAFKELSLKLPTNGWIWAFLGASQYSQYAFEADESYKVQALDSFRKAKQYRSWKGGLPDKYFSRRIRRIFETAG